MRARILSLTPGLMLLSLILALLLPAGISAQKALAAPTASDHLITNIVLTPLTPNVLAVGENVNLTFDYQTTEPGGVRIFARPYTGSIHTPDYSAHGSGVYPTGTGTASGFFTVHSPAVVDRIELRMFNADQSELLFEAYIPVHFEFVESDHTITSIELDPGHPNIIGYGTNLTVNVDYSTTEPGGVRIFARPFTDGALSPGYSASGSPLYPAGTGTASGTFTINSGPVLVDQIRIQMTNADQSVLLNETFIPVYFLFTDPRYVVTFTQFNPLTPNILDHGSQVHQDFSYSLSGTSQARIFIRPLSYGELSPNYSASGSALYPVGSGTGSSNFTINSSPVIVDHIRIQMTNADQTLLLFEATVPVYYQFGPVHRVFMPVQLRE